MKKILLLLFFFSIPLLAKVDSTNDSAFQKRKSSYSAKRKSTKRKSSSTKRKYASRRSYSKSTNSCSYNGNSLNVGPRGGCYYYARSGNKVYIDRGYCGNCY
mgnify:CR=1 FL=1